MAKIKEYTTTEVAQMVQMFKDGATYAEIGEMFGRSKDAVRLRLNKEGCHTHDYPKSRRSPKRLKTDDQPVAVTKSEAPVPVLTLSRKPSLKDFSPREIIKYLYSLGYRIENNQLVCIQRVVVNLKSVLEED